MMSDLRKEQDQADLSILVDSLGKEDQRKLLLAGDRGASNWLTALPIKDCGLALHKRDFNDVLCLRYGWQPADLPKSCALGTIFPVES